MHSTRWCDKTPCRQMDDYLPLCVGSAALASCLALNAVSITCRVLPASKLKRCFVVVDVVWCVQTSANKTCSC